MRPMAPAWTEYYRIASGSLSVSPGAQCTRLLPPVCTDVPCRQCAGQTQWYKSGPGYMRPRWPLHRSHFSRMQRQESNLVEELVRNFANSCGGDNAGIRFSRIEHAFCGQPFEGVLPGAEEDSS